MDIWISNMRKNNSVVHVRFVFYREFPVLRKYGLGHRATRSLGTQVRRFHSWPINNGCICRCCALLDYLGTGSSSAIITYILSMPHFIPDVGWIFVVPINSFSNRETNENSFFLFPIMFPSLGSET